MNTNSMKHVALAIGGIMFFGSIAAFSQAEDESKLSYSAQRKALTEERKQAQADEAEEKTATLSEFNQVSHLLGIEIRDQKNEKLGKITDLVIDLKNERVAYAVLSVDEGFLNLGEKLFAVPLEAFIQISDVDYMYLYTDRDKLAQARGFSEENWPGIQSPAWGAEPFWKRTADEKAETEKSQTEEPE